MCRIRSNRLRGLCDTARLEQFAVRSPRARSAQEGSLGCYFLFPSEFEQARGNEANEISRAVASREESPRRRSAPSTRTPELRIKYVTARAARLLDLHQSFEPRVRGKPRVREGLEWRVARPNKSRLASQGRRRLRSSSHCHCYCIASRLVHRVSSSCKSNDIDVLEEGALVNSLALHSMTSN